jgi:hypothetical protein
MIPLLVTLAVGIGGFLIARNFVRSRLRFVDAVYSPLAPFLAGLLAAIVAWPLALLPLLHVTTAVVFGIGVGAGTASGAKFLKRNNSQARLNP